MSVTHDTLHMNVPLFNLIDVPNIGVEYINALSSGVEEKDTDQLVNVLISHFKDKNVTSSHRQQVIEYVTSRVIKPVPKTAKAASSGQQAVTVLKEESDDDDDGEPEPVVPTSNVLANVIIPDSDPNGFNVSNGDMNGECFIVHGEGESLVSTGGTKVVFGVNTPCANDGNQITNIRFTSAQMVDFVVNNANFLRNAEPGISEKDAAIVAYIRYLGASNGLISPRFVPKNHHVDYNDAFVWNDYRENANSASIRPHLTNVVREKIRSVFSDLVCCVAYMFRVRGHHYLDDMEIRYNKLWARCLQSANDLPVNWKLISRNALHAIFPDTLDDFWSFCRDNSFCAGSLCKRFDCAPAGSSGVLALIKGIKDIQLIIPSALKLVEKEVKQLDQLGEAIRNSRWGASVNNRFYGVPRIRVIEDHVGVLASVVLAIYERLAPQSDLRNAPSLLRLATLAPATGAAIGRIVSNTVSDERMRIVDQAGSTMAIVPKPS